MFDSHEVSPAPGESAEDSSHAPTQGDAPKKVDSFKVNDNGVWYQAEGDESPTWICSRLDVEARTRDGNGSLWGYLLHWVDADQRAHNWPMPAELLKGSGEEYRGTLLDGGLRIAPGAKARNLLSVYIQSREPKQLARCTDRVGWHDGVFVLPDRNIGKAEERLLYQSAAFTPTRVRTQGSLEEWRENIGELCVGNSRLILAVCTAFAAPILKVIGAENGGVHFISISSSGKTTALKVAASVWGGSDYLQRWRTTDNGLEAIAAASNDLPLILDEIGQLDGRRAGEVAYMLANGSGKHRANRHGLSRPAASWRLLFLSSGEAGLADLMQEAGRKAKAGQEIRLLEVPGDAGNGYGLFETIHNLNSGAEFSDYLLEQSSQFYGIAGVTFLECISKHLGSLQYTFGAMMRKIRDALMADVVNPSGQTERAANRFALIGAAGELATAHGITGWPKEAPREAMKTCFDAWLNRRGGSGNQEHRDIIRQVQLFFELHGDSRFVNPLSERDSKRAVVNRAGDVRHDNDEAEFFVLPQVFRQEVCKGLDTKTATQVLEQAGMLQGADGKKSQVKRLEGIGSTRCYVIKPFKILRTDEN